MRYQTIGLPSAATAGNIGRSGISLIGQSSSAAALRRMVTLSAATDAPLMLTGPIGSEKRDIANVIHGQSDRSAAGFVAINCATIDHSMLSGGLLDGASGGSIFFDEISDLQPALHKHLYHLLEARNIRIISATNETVDGLQQKFGIPAELYASLSVLVLPVPPLAHRKMDISLLIEAHIQQLPKEIRYTIDQAAENSLSNYDWPGNLGEMRELVGRIAKLHAQQRVSVGQLPVHIQQREPSPVGFHSVDDEITSAHFETNFDLKGYLAKEEAKYIIAALEKSGGIVQRAAAMTGIKRTTFLAKMRKYEIERAAGSE